MSRFKPGDKVTPVNVDRYTHRNFDQLKKLLGRTLVVRSVHNDEFTSAVFAGVPGDGCWQWHPNDLRLVSVQPEPEADPAPAQKPLRRGDLVEFCGNIWVVIDAHPAHGGYWIGAITGDPGTRYSNASELTRVGSIFKKVKRLEAQKESRNAE